MDTNVNYEELKDTTKTFLQMVTDNDLYYALFLLVILIVILKVVDLVFHPLRKRGSMLAGFLRATIKVFCLITFGMRICALVPVLKDFTNQIVLSSSLIVVVLGFVFQEGLSNIVHGFIISVFRPFKIGDRITVSVDGERITGYVREISARHTVIQEVVNSTHVIVPNSKMDMSVVGNSYYEKNAPSTAFLDLEITYESDLDKALELVRQAVERHPLVHKAREDNGMKDPVMVQVRDLGDSGIALRAVVCTATVEENFRACSDIRRYLVHCFAQEPDIELAYPHMQLVQEKISSEREGKG